MSPAALLVFGCFGLGLVIGYAWWVRVRSDILRLDLARTRDRLDAAMEAKGLTRDRGYLVARRLITALIDLAPFLSPAVLSLRVTLADNGMAIDPAPVGLIGDDTDPDVLAALVSTMKRLLLFISVECISGWPIVLLLGWTLLVGMHKRGGVPVRLARLLIHHPELLKLGGISP